MLTTLRVMSVWLLVLTAGCGGSEAEEIGTSPNADARLRSELLGLPDPIAIVKSIIPKIVLPPPDLMASIVQDNPSAPSHPDIAKTAAPIVALVYNSQNASDRYCLATFNATCRQLYSDLAAKLISSGGGSPYNCSDPTVCTAFALMIQHACSNEQTRASCQDLTMPNGADPQQLSESLIDIAIAYAALEAQPMIATVESAPVTVGDIFTESGGLATMALGDDWAEPINSLDTMACSTLRMQRSGGCGANRSERCYGYDGVPAFAFYQVHFAGVEVVRWTLYKRWCGIKNTKITRQDKWTEAWYRTCFSGPEHPEARTTMISKTHGKTTMDDAFQMNCGPLPKQYQGIRSIEFWANGRWR